MEVQMLQLTLSLHIKKLLRRDLKDWYTQLICTWTRSFGNYAQNNVFLQNLETRANIGTFINDDLT